MTRATIRTFVLVIAIAIAVATAVASSSGQSVYEKDLEIRPSRIPHAGNGVYTKVAIPKGSYLGAYTGEFITEDEYQRRLVADRWQYMMGLLDCVTPHTQGITTIDGLKGNVFTRMNYAPSEFQNVKFEKICEPPFVRILALCLEERLDLTWRLVAVGRREVALVGAGRRDMQPCWGYAIRV
jgi:hypothetical protein